jgi:aminoglycoside phosphotransferase (APT) family kinase protein
MERAPEELTGAATEVGRLLAERRPPEQEPTLVHGDYHYGNMLFAGAEVVAVLDWEIAQLGQPLLDLGCLCVIAQRRNFEGAPNPGGGIDVPVERIVELYGADPAEFRWYLALSCYKYASIFGYNLMLHRRGKRPDPMYESMTDTITGLIDKGRELVEGT